MLCAILLCAAVAAYAGVNLSMNVNLADRLQNVENRMDIPVNSTLSAFQKSNTFLVIPHGTGVCLMNGSGYFQEFLANQTQVMMDGLYNASITGGSVYVQEGSYSASVIIQNNTRFILETGARGITYSVAPGAYCILDDFNSWIFQYYSNGNLYSQFDYANSNLLVQSANLTSIYATSLDELSSGQGVKVLHFIVENGTSFPAIPIEKQIFFRTDQGYLYIYSSGSWTSIGVVPSTYPWANLTGVPVLIYANGSQGLTADWNIAGYGIYGATWLNGTQMNTSNFWLNGQNRTDTLAYPIEPVAYVVDFSDGVTARVKNCTTGQVDYANSNQTLALQYAFNHTDWTGAHGTQKVVLRGNFSLNYYPNVPAYADIEIQGYLSVVNKAAFMICFDDGIPIQYTTYFPNMTSIWGYRGNQGIVVDWVAHAGATNSSYETLANLQAMKNAGWSFYSHGWYSIDLSAATVTLLQQDQEIRQSKDWIERNLGVRIDSIQWGSAKQGYSRNCEAILQLPCLRKLEIMA